LDVVSSIAKSLDLNRKDFIKKLSLDNDEEHKVVCP
jgi:hypothetical protein